MTEEARDVLYLGTASEYLRGLYAPIWPPHAAREQRVLRARARSIAKEMGDAFEARRAVGLKPNRDVEFFERQTIGAACPWQPDPPSVQVG